MKLIIISSVTDNKLDTDTGDEVYCVGNDDGILISNNILYIV